MRITPPVVNYLELRPNNLLSDKFRHLLLLIWWPIYGILFGLTDSDVFTELHEYIPVESVIDSYIPFCEFFVIPYMFWFAFLVIMHVYTLFYDIDGFKRLMWFIMITYSVTLVIYWIIPTKQELRPAAFERDNFLVDFMKDFYAYDTPRNVCPSIHVLGAVACGAAGWNSERFSSVWWKVGFAVCTVLICLSTVFLKQHSIVDVFVAIPLCVIAYMICYRKQDIKPKVKIKSPAA